MTDTTQGAWMREYERRRSDLYNAAYDVGAARNGQEEERAEAVAAMARKAMDAHVRGLVEALSGLLSEPPTFRDYTGTDEDTCGYCHTALEGYEGRVRGEHSPTCPWAIARAALAAPSSAP